MKLTNILLPYLIKKSAQAHGFLDPIKVLAQLSRFGQPSEVMAPTELLRATAILHARGLLNAQVIQHNLDWIWPFWVNKQFNPNDISFIPRSFSLTHINLTHRNWTAAGLPDAEETPLVDPRGLVTPFWDGWSIDAWIVDKEREDLIPSRIQKVQQRLDLRNNSIVTEFVLRNMKLTSTVKMIREQQIPVCQINLLAEGYEENSLAISLRPYNPEGVSLVKNIELLENQAGWRVNKNQKVYFNAIPQRYTFSDYHKGDVYHHLFGSSAEDHIQCPVEMSSAAATFLLGAEKRKEVTVSIPLQKKSDISSSISTNKEWGSFLQGSCRVNVPDDKFQFLFDASMRTVLTHTAKEVYAGPYTYKRFWFRDAVFITYALLCSGFHKRAEKIIDQFNQRQKLSGYFESQEGEWDSNGQVLWLIQKYCQMTNQQPKDEWQNMISKGARWILRKRLSDDSQKLHSGLMPSGFSAEHFGPNNYYYWDNFWSLAGLRSSSWLLQQYGDRKHAKMLLKEVKKFAQSIDSSLEKVEKKLQSSAMPSSPYRRLDSASVGSLVAGYPLQLWDGSDKRLLETAQYLYDNCLVHNGLFHDMSHSGINPYLTLHIAQVFLRLGDARYYSLMKGIADLASSTGQWPEAVHPKTLGGCMGDGQHTWASAEWIVMMRNCFVREDENERKLILCSGIPTDWLKNQNILSFGPAPTLYGNISMKIKVNGNNVDVQWEGEWHKQKPYVEVRMLGDMIVSSKEGIA
ncbi:MAG: hypothetical protein P9M07_03305 [Candidatus Aceula meridiana]|nr:hypothetical protein [Candidatus Aceula meridiana]